MFQFFKDARNVLREYRIIQEQKSWDDAVQYFLRNDGADWPGGDEMKTALQETISMMGLCESPCKERALARAWAYMRAIRNMAPRMTPPVDTLKR
jgi:hypothetical protein